MSNTLEKNQVEKPELNPQVFQKHISIQSPSFTRFTQQKSEALITKHLNKTGALSAIVVLELSAQNPYNAIGNMDFYKPGRWDTSSNLFFMDVIVHGPLPGEWEGTVGYVRFTAPADATYVVFIYFTGYQTTMQAYGPWGIVEASTATTDDTGLLLVVWSGNAGDNLYFNINCYGPVIGYLESVLFYEYSF